MRSLSDLAPGRLTVVGGCSGSGKTFLCGAWSEQSLALQHPVLWLDGDQTLSRLSFLNRPDYQRYFWGYRPRTPQQAFDLALAFLRLQVGGLVILDSLDGLLPVWRDQQAWAKRFMPRLIGALHRSRARFLCTTQALSGDVQSVLSVYAYQRINLEGFYDVY